MPQYDVILFDLDGTLTDSRVGIIRSVRYALSKFGLSEHREDLLVSFIGAPLFKSMQEHYSMTEEQARQAVEHYREYYSEKGIYENEIYPGIPKFLEELKARGKRLIVATLKPTKFAERIIEHFKLAPYFEKAVGFEAEGHSKTDIIEIALAGLGDVPKERIIMVGDRVHDIVGAEKNGIHSIAVSYGYGSLEELQNAKPTYIVDSVEGLRELLSGF